MLTNEIIKIVRNKIFLCTVLIALSLNAVLICWQEFSGYHEYAGSYEEYNAINKDLSGLTDIEKLTYIDDKLEVTEDSSLVNQYDNLQLYEDVLAEIKAAVNYAETLEAIESNSERILKRINVKVDAYNYERVQKSIKVYSNLKDIEVDYQPSRGILLFMDNVVTDGVIVIVMLFAVVILISYEREKNLLLLSKCTKNGKAKHAFIKMLSVLIVDVVATVLLYAQTFIIAEIFYDLGDLARPIQSVYGYSYCAIKTSILGYICIYIGIKMLFFAMCAGFFFMVSCIFRRALSVYAVAAAIVSVLVAVYSLIPDTSYLVDIKNYNPVSFGQVEKMLSQFQCLDIWGHAYDMVKIYVGCMILLLILCVSIGIVVYTKSCEREVKGFEGLNILNRTSYHTSMFGHEMHKVYAIQKVGIIHVIGVIIAYGIFIFSSDTGYEDFFTKQLSEDIEGKYTSEVGTRIDERIAFVEEAMMSYEGSNQSDEYIGYELQKLTLEGMRSYAAYLEGKPGSYYIYNLGYSRLIGEEYEFNNQNLKIAILAALVAVICFTATMSIDYQHGEDKLIRSTVNGRRRYIFIKVIIGLISTLVIYITTWIPALVNTLSKYGTEFINAPAYSLQSLSHIPSWITIGMYILLIYFVRFIGLVIIMLVSYATVSRLRSSALSILVIVAIFVGPIILYMLGVEEMRYLTVFWL